MSRQYNMYNVQCAEMWKQRIRQENTHNIPYLNPLGSELGDDDDNVSMISGSTRLSNLRAPSSSATESENRRMNLCHVLISILRVQHADDHG
jgi:hypothetical protein